MPELPEVETIKRGLRPLIVKKKIVKVDVDAHTPKSFQGDIANVVDAKVVKLERRGKALLIDLDNGYTMMIHLRMTGQLIWRDDAFSGRFTSSNPPARGSSTLSTASLRASNYPRNSSQIKASLDLPRTSSKNTESREIKASLDSSGYSLKNTELREDEVLNGSEASLTAKIEFEDGEYEEIMKHQFAAGHPSKNFTAALPNGQTRVSFEFEDGTLYFNDQRKFGFVKVIPTSEVEQEKFIAELAKEPWEMCTQELFSQCQRHKNAPIKAVLLDQKIIAGLGNIYADESLFYASVHPATKAGELSEEQVRRILEGARSVMLASIDSGGSTMATYIKPDGSTGNYLELFAEVFRRDGQLCKRCGEVIKKTRVAGRGTHYCPKCQKAPEYLIENAGNVQKMDKNKQKWEKSDENDTWLQPPKKVASRRVRKV